MAVYSIGISRAFGYDASVTVADFVRTPSVWDPWKRQVVFNNHPLFSFLERLVFAATGSTSETTMRVLPILFASVAVGATVWFLSERWSLTGSVIGGLLLAANPVFLSNSRDVRGYSLIVLCSVVSTAMLLRTTERSRAVYLVALTAGAMTHIYMLAVIPCHAAYLLARRRVHRPWVPLWLVSGAAGLVAFIPSIPSLGLRGRLFRPAFPIELLRAGLGETPLAVALASIVILVCISRLRNHAWAIGLGAAMVTVVWLYGPADLYPRFFVWATPLLSVAVAVAVTRDRRIAPLALAAVVLTLAPQLRPLRTDDLANRGGAHALAPYQHPCVLGWPSEAMGPYGSPRFSAVGAPAGLDACDAALVLEPNAQPELTSAARRRFTSVRTLPATMPALLFSDPFRATVKAEHPEDRTFQ